MVGINVEEPEPARAFRSRNSLTYPVLSDPDAKAYWPFRRGDILSALIPIDAVATPYNVIVDRKGVVRYRGFSFDEDKIRGLVEELLAAGA